MFDTVGKLGWRVDVQTHTIKTVIQKVLEIDVEGGWDRTEDGIALDVPLAKEEEDCVVSGRICHYCSFAYSSHNPGLLQVGIW